MPTTQPTPDEFLQYIQETKSLTRGQAIGYVRDAIQSGDEEVANARVNIPNFDEFIAQQYQGIPSPLRRLGTGIVRGLGLAPAALLSLEKGTMQPFRNLAKVGSDIPVSGADIAGTVGEMIGSAPLFGAAEEAVAPLALRYGAMRAGTTPAALKAAGFIGSEPFVSGVESGALKTGLRATTGAKAALSGGIIGAMDPDHPVRGFLEGLGIGRVAGGVQNIVGNFLSRRATEFQSNPKLHEALRLIAEARHEPLRKVTAEFLNLQQPKTMADIQVEFIRHNLPPLEPFSFYTPQDFDALTGSVVPPGTQGMPSGNKALYTAKPLSEQTGWFEIAGPTKTKPGIIRDSGDAFKTQEPSGQSILTPKPSRKRVLAEANADFKAALADAKAARDYTNTQQYKSELTARSYSAKKALRKLDDLSEPFTTAPGELPFPWERPVQTPPEVAGFTEKELQLARGAGLKEPQVPTPPKPQTTVRGIPSEVEMSAAVEAEKATRGIFEAGAAMRQPEPPPQPFEKSQWGTISPTTDLLNQAAATVRSRVEELPEARAAMGKARQKSRGVYLRSFPGGLFEGEETEAPTFKKADPERIAKLFETISPRKVLEGVDVAPGEVLSDKPSKAFIGELASRPGIIGRFFRIPAAIFAKDPITANWYRKFVDAKTSFLFKIGTRMDKNIAKWMKFYDITGNEPFQEEIHKAIQGLQSVVTDTGVRIDQKNEVSSRADQAARWFRQHILEKSYEIAAGYKPSAEQILKANGIDPDRSGSYGHILKRLQDIQDTLDPAFAKKNGRAGVVYQGRISALDEKLAELTKGLINISPYHDLSIVPFNEGHTLLLPIQNERRQLQQDIAELQKWVEISGPGSQNISGYQSQLEQKLKRLSELEADMQKRGKGQFAGQSVIPGKQWWSPLNQARTSSQQPESAHE